MATATLLIVDDEPLVRCSLKERFSGQGYTIVEADTARGALAQAHAGIDLVLLDDRLPDGDGLMVLRHVREVAPDTPIVFMTAASSIDAEVEAMKFGACHSIHKPFDLDDVAAIVEQALATGRLRREVRAYRTRQGRRVDFDAIVGESPAIVAAKTLLARAASNGASTVLLTGETGTGKGLAAKAIHDNSERAPKPFVDITCSALTQHVVEGELFGHELEMADGGTILLGEIGETPRGLQLELLRFLEEKTFKRVGGLADIRVNVGLIATTNRDLEAEVKAGRFLADLFARLQATTIEMPALRDRDGDVERLARFYIERYNGEFRRRVRGLQPDALALLQRHRWPGNVRELRNAVERATFLAPSDWLTTADFGSLASSDPPAAFRLPPEGVVLEDLERQLLTQALERCGGNQTQAGKLLGINRDQVRYRIEKFGLTRSAHPAL